MFTVDVKQQCNNNNNNFLLQMTVFEIHFTMIALKKTAISAAAAIEKNKLSRFIFSDLTLS